MKLPDRVARKSDFKGPGAYPVKGCHVEIGDDIAEMVDLQNHAFPVVFCDTDRFGKLQQHGLLQQFAEFFRCNTGRQMSGDGGKDIPPVECAAHGVAEIAH